MNIARLATLFRWADQVTIGASIRGKVVVVTLSDEETDLVSFAVQDAANKAAEKRRKKRISAAKNRAAPRPWASGT
jgi:hypothetical protein